MMKKPKTPRLVTVSIFTTVTLIFWVFFSLYNILVTTPTVDVEAEVLEPLDPELDLNILNSLPEKVFFNEGDVANIVPTPTSVPEVETVVEEEVLESTEPISPTVTGVEPAEGV